MRNKYSSYIGVISKILQGIKVLGHKNHVHNILGCGSVNLFSKAHNTVAKTINNCQTLASNTRSSKCFTLSIGFGSSNNRDLLSLGFVNRGIFHPLCFHNGIHSVLDFRSRINIGDKGLENFKTIAGHNLIEFLLHCASNLVLGLKEFIKGNLWHSRTNDIKDIVLDLRARVGQRIVSGEDFIWDNLVLDRTHHLNKDIILGFGFALNVELLDPQRDQTRDFLKTGIHAVATRRSGLYKATPLLNHTNRSLRDSETTTHYFLE
mmetsp:Transcript_8507/g.11478  ORF Transcript_8507/g.11478 Transcript_8507/m.11478 type:complete len:263 (+) Transcript_8507:266-1054(+)